MKVRNFLSKVWQKINPFKRGKSRFSIRRVLKASALDRLYGKFRNIEIDPNEILAELSIVRSRANWLYLNDPFVHGAIDTIINRAIGSGSILQATTQNTTFNENIETTWEKWCMWADYYRQFHFADIQRLCLLKLFLDGGVFLRVLPDKRNTISPIALEILEYGRLANERAGAKNGNVIINGVEVNDEGKVVAYHFKGPSNPLQPAYKIIRVPAEEIIHFSPFRRPGQLLGVPLLTPAIPYALQLSELIEAELVNAKVSACFGIVIKKAGAYAEAFNMPEENGERVFEIAPGMVEFLEPGEDIDVIDAKRPGNNFDDFVKLILRGIGRSLGLSYEQISGDKSEVNYSSTRHSELEFQDFVNVLVKALERYVLTPVYYEFLKHSVMLGAVTAQGGIKDWTNWTQHKWIHKGFAWVDPLKEVQAVQLALKSGLTTLTDELAKRGKDLDEVIRQRKKEIEELNKAGLLDVTQQGLKEDNVSAVIDLNKILTDEEEGVDGTKVKQ